MKKNQIYTASTEKRPPPPRIRHSNQHTGQTSVKFLQLNIAHIYTLCANISGNLTYRSYFITRFQLRVKNTSFPDNTDYTRSVISNEAVCSFINNSYKKCSKYWYPCLKIVIAQSWLYFKDFQTCSRGPFFRGHGGHGHQNSVST